MSTWSSAPWGELVLAVVSAIVGWFARHFTAANKE